MRVEVKGQRPACGGQRSPSTTWVLRTELRRSGSAVDAFTHRAVSRVPFSICIFTGQTPRETQGQRGCSGRCSLLLRAPDGNRYIEHGAVLWSWVYFKTDSDSSSHSNHPCSARLRESMDRRGGERWAQTSAFPWTGFREDSQVTHAVRAW